MGETDEQREERERRRLRGALGLFQIGMVGFLVMIAAGLLPRLLAGWFAPLGAPWLGVAAGLLAALVAVAISVVRLRRTWRDAPPPAPGEDDPRRR
ncbi:hypothetical protein [Anaeromyxobacter sp. Fw109-5]|uniref:hypothetical protein n=1 Tax=Anaeromyxobacter sp. (strain Fw109-5) TaxID=404589 RepID=UPI0002E73E99|nr:hypothetical protein [Anaeromyxobacter sp. Fw109-5]